MQTHDLKEYQQESIDAICSFCESVRRAVGSGAMRPVHDAFYAETGRDYIEVPQLPGVPYACLRVPTGGGKTLIAAHAVGAIAKHLGHQDRPLCLWVTPSTTIRDQTLRGLRDREHPYRQALREGLGGVPVEVLTMEEAMSASRAMVSSKALIVVTTIQSYRIDQENNRRVYQDSGYLMDHFSNLPAWVREDVTEAESGVVRLSLANAMKLRGPIVIMDEAHNARTRVSFDSLARFEPLAVLELTATPQQDHDPEQEKYASNVLHAVSALQLHREGMIKLPVELESRDNWLDVLARTVNLRSELERVAAEWGQSSGRYIRPIALLQAQPRSKTRETHTADAVKEALLERCDVPAEHIRVATGDNDDLGDEDLSDPGCPVRYVVTVDKLREGWDCPFAYVLGSVGNVATATAVEQLLGRVLRMPGAVPTGRQELDRAYAVVQSEDVIQTARGLCDSLVQRCGFDAQTVGDVLRVHRHADPQGRFATASIPVSEPVDVSGLAGSVRHKVAYDAEAGALRVNQPLSREEAVELRDAMTTLTGQAAVEEYWQSERSVGTAAKQLDEYAEPIRVPQLTVRDGERMYLFEPEELDEFSWDLDRCDAVLSDDDFSTLLNVGDRVSLGVSDRGGVRVGGVEQVMVRQLALVAEGDDWSRAELVRWLDRDLHRGGAMAGLPPSQSQAWLMRVVESMVEQRGADLPILVRKRHELATVLGRRIAAHGRVRVREAANRLISGESPRELATSMERPGVITEQDYCVYREYGGPFEFDKHAFTKVGTMGEEESQCAKRINEHPNVRRWLRNLEHESAGGFSLPLSPGRFFPDFIAELEDGRLALIEYKNSTLAQAASERHKKVVGELWAERSDAHGVYGWVVDRDWATLDACLTA